MNTRKIYDEDGKGSTRVFSHEEIVRVKPLEFFKNFEIQKRAIIFRDLLHAKDPVTTAQLSPEFFIKEALRDLGNFFDPFENMTLPENLELLLQTTRKKDQVVLLKDVALTTDLLIGFIIQSNTKYGYLFSRYRFETLPKGFEDKQLPKLFQLNENGTLYKVGETKLTDGQLRQILEQRKVIVSNFFEKGDTWHCFFITYSSIAGGENWKEGQPHFHYVSSAFGITKDEFIESMRTGNYRATSVHIDLLDYGKQKKDGI